MLLVPHFKGASVPRSTNKKEAGLEDLTEQAPSLRAGEPSRNSPPTTMTTAQSAYDTDEGDEGTTSASDEEYHSFDSSDSEEGTRDPAADGKKEHEARELERQRVLEAAGLLVKLEAERNDEHNLESHNNDAPSSSSAPPRPPRRRSTRRRRRTPPQTPSTNTADANADVNEANRSSLVSVSSEKELPLPPTPVSVLHVDDAFERYEAYRQSKNWRMSISSIDTGPPSPGLGPGPTAMSATPSRDSGGEHRQSQSGHSHIFNFLTRRKTPTHEPERPRLQISGPILSAGHSIESLSRPGSPSFGSVSISMSWDKFADVRLFDSLGLACWEKILWKASRA